MRNISRYIFPLVAAGAAAGIFGAPLAAADTQLIDPSTPNCEVVAGSTTVGDQTTECATPGNVQLNASPEVTAYPYPWGDEFYGPAMVIGGFGGGGYNGGGGGYNGGGGGHGGGGGGGR